jgi:hypothetical protein
MTGKRKVICGLVVEGGVGRVSPAAPVPGRGLTPPPEIFRGLSLDGYPASQHSLAFSRMTAPVFTAWGHKSMGK